MILRSRKSRAGMLLLLDICCMTLVFIIAGSIRNGRVSVWLTQPVYINISAIGLLCYVLLFLLGGEQEQDVFRQGYFVSFLSILKKKTITLGVIFLYLFSTKQTQDASRIIMLSTYIFDILADYVVRFQFKQYLIRYFKVSTGATKVMLVTTSDRAEEIIRNMQEDKGSLLEFQYVSILDADLTGQEILGVPVIGNIDNMTATHRQYVYDEVLFHVAYNREFPLEKLIFGFEQMGIVVHVNIDIFNINMENKIISTFGKYHVVSFAGQTHNASLMLVKRLMDIMGAIIGLIFTGLAVIIFGIQIYAQDKGPIFFAQTRVGINGRRFKIYKFRSMYMDAEERKKDLMDQNLMKGFMFKMENDPRITPVGKFIRKTSVDELPQFWNVLKGDMSLVGTRPPTVDEYKQYQNYHMRRLSIKPGITGLWQVSGRNQITDFDEVVKLDLQYIDRWSLLLDIRIIFQTIGVVFTGSGAK